MKRIAVIGGNAAGPSAAAKAKRTDPNAEVVLFEAGCFISTGTCELPYLISGEIKNHTDIVFYSPETFFEEKKVKVYTSHLVEQIIRKEKRITVKNLQGKNVFDYNYDKLIITTGSYAVKPAAFNNCFENVFFLKNVSDYLRIKKYIEENIIRKVLIIGAGYIGLECAEAFKTFADEITVIDKDSLPLPSFDPEIRHLALGILNANGVEFKGNVENFNIYESNNRVKKVKFNSELQEYDLILSAAGFVPNTQLALGANLNTGDSGGIKTDLKLRTSDQDIYAAGDCIEVQNRVTGRNEFIPLASLAHSYGHIAGANAAGDNLSVQSVIKNIAMKLFDKTIVSAGINSLEAYRHRFSFNSASAVSDNLVKVMPASGKTFGKIIFENKTKKILGAQFLGGSEVIGYGDLISSLIFQKSDASILSRNNYNYSPPCSPFVNILSVLGKKIEGAV